MNKSINKHSVIYELLKDHSERFAVEVKDLDSPLSHEFAASLDNLNILVIGAGDLFNGYLNLSEKLRFLLGKNSRLSIFDPNLSDKRPLEGNFIRSFEEIEKDSLALILSPNYLHLRHLEELLKLSPVKGIYCEKPMCINDAELQKLDKLVGQTSKPLFFGDFFYYKALSLLSLSGVPMPHRNLLKIEFDDTQGAIEDALKNNVPLLGNIKRIEGRLLKGGHPSLFKRKWIFEKEQGGGVMLDLMIHLLNLAGIIGHKIASLNSVELLKYSFRNSENAPKGVYSELLADEAEDYAHISGKMTNGAEFDFKSAQYALNKENYLLLEDEYSNKLKVSLSRTDRSLEYFDKSGVLSAKINLSAAPYLLMMHHALNYLNMSGNNTTPLFYEEQFETITQIENIKLFSKKTPPF